MRLQDNATFLETFVNNNRGRNSLLNKASEEELKTLVECILNFESVHSEFKDKLEKRFAKLFKIEFENLSRVKRAFHKHLAELVCLVEIVLASYREREICQVLSNG